MTRGDSPAIAYRQDLDGLRAIAISLVLVTHAGLPTNAGQAGVTGFFVLSGFLITSLLEAERFQTGGIDLRAFYGRRFRRLGPAFVTMMLGVVALGLLGAWSGMWLVGVGLAASHVGNNAIAFGFPDGGPASNAWSLNIEEQFYALWPLFLLALSRRTLMWMVPAAIAASIVTRFAGLEIHSTPARVDALLVGCLAALRGWTFPPAIGLMGLAVLLVAGLIPNPAAAVTEATIGASLIVASRIPIDRLAPIGRRAYSLYLWSWPMTSLPGGPIGLLATIAAAELSYRTVEHALVTRRDTREGRLCTAPTTVAHGRRKVL